MSAYYNEIDPYAAQWLRNLIKAGHIAPGEVDERSIEDVRPEEIKKFKQCHFFAGVGVWSYALRQAGVPDDFKVWTGSCPCQPFSAAGKGGGVDDSRHLWPAWNHLISQVRPDLIFGEQVASKDGLGWLDLVQSDLEGQGYAFGAADLCAAGIGAPHIRQRLYFVAEGVDNPVRHRRANGQTQRCGDGQIPVTATGVVKRGTGRSTSELADTERTQEHQEQQRPAGHEGEWQANGTCGCDTSGGLADSHGAGLQGHRRPLEEYAAQRREDEARHDRATSEHDRAGPTNGHWRDADWLFCRDGKWRPVEPGTFPLAHGSAARVGRLRAYGNAIVAQKAQIFIESYFESREERFMARRNKK